jgi:tRNA U38,U39,U40 pseudouridine synthase TruA
MEFFSVQVRCIATVLHYVGSGFEQPEIVQDLLNISANPGRPQYPLASESPLLLHSAGFSDHLSPQFRISESAARMLSGKVRGFRINLTLQDALCLYFASIPEQELA